jgi:hypothetical protein
MRRLDGGFRSPGFGDHRSRLVEERDEDGPLNPESSREPEYGSGLESFLSLTSAFLRRGFTLAFGLGIPTSAAGCTPHDYSLKMTGSSRPPAQSLLAKFNSVAAIRIVRLTPATARNRR